MKIDSMILGEVARRSEIVIYLSYLELPARAEQMPDFALIFHSILKKYPGISVSLSVVEGQPEAEAVQKSLVAVQAMIADADVSADAFISSIDSTVLAEYLELIRASCELVLRSNTSVEVAPPEALTIEADIFSGPSRTNH